MLKYALRYLPLLGLLLLLIPWHLYMASWTNQSTAAVWSPYNPGSALYGVTMLSSNDVWAVGGSFEQQESQPRERIIYAVSGVILHYTDGAWAVVDTPQKPLFSVSLDSPRDGWAVGYGGILVHYDGKTWSTVTGPANFNSNLLGITMTSPENGWAVGYGGSILHYDGQQWTAYPSPTTADLRAIAMPSPQEGWAVGDSGTILHYHAGTWSLVKSAPATSNALRSISMLSADEGWTVGDNGTILHYRGEDGVWEGVYRAPGLQSIQLVGVAMSTVRAGWIVGEQQFLTYRSEVWTGPESVSCPIGGKTPVPGTYLSLYGITMAGSGEGWAVGALDTPAASLSLNAYSILHYTHGQWCAAPSF